jgi:hypothetical protein
MCNEMPVETTDPNELSWEQVRELGVDAADDDMVAAADDSEA